MNEPETVPLSALQHWAYCPRQCALIHLDQTFDDNLHTMRGQALHALVDQPGVESAHGTRVERALPLWHDELGLIGKADAVQFGPDGTPYPVEYKNGSRHKAAAVAACDDLQLAAQAMCLEFMTGRAVHEGAIYYAKSRRRRVVPVTGDLRARVREAAAAVRALLLSPRLPPPLQGDAATRRCNGCSLRDRCLPEASGSAALALLRRTLFDPDD